MLVCANTLGQEDLRWNKMHVVVSRLRAEEKQISCSNARNSSWFRRIFHMATNANIVTIGLIQMRCTSQPQANLRKGLAFIEKAARRGVQIICLPELFRSLYFCQTEDHRQFALAESIPGPTTTALAKAARQHRVTIVGSIFEKRSAGIYHNTAIILDAKGKLVGKYRKMHIPDDPLYYEKFYFTPGDLGFQSFATKYANIGTLVCWDQWYPEGARLTALKGAQILFYPTAIGWHRKEKKPFGQKQHEAWVTIQRSHAIAIDQMAFDFRLADGNSGKHPRLKKIERRLFADQRMLRIDRSCQHDIVRKRHLLPVIRRKTCQEIFDRLELVVIRGCHVGSCSD